MDPSNLQIVLRSQQLCYQIVANILLLSPVRLMGLMSRTEDQQRLQRIEQEQLQNLPLAEDHLSEEKLLSINSTLLL